MAGYTVFAEGKKYNLSKLKQLLGKQAEQQHSTGITLEGIWKTKDNRILVVTHSVWQRGQSGEVQGTQAHFASAHEITKLADRYGGDLMNLVPEST
jgi:hypothetical protein